MQIFSSLIFKGRFNVTHYSEQHWAPQQTMVLKYKKEKCEPYFIRDSFMYSWVQNVLSHFLMSPFVWRLCISISTATISEMCGFSNVCMQYLCSVFCIQDQPVLALPTLSTECVRTCIVVFGLWMCFRIFNHISISQPRGRVDYKAATAQLFTLNCWFAS